MLEDTSLDVQEDCHDENALVLSLHNDVGLAEDDGPLFAASSNDGISERISKQLQLASSGIKQCYRTYSPYEPAMFLLALKESKDCGSCLLQSRTANGCPQEQSHDGPFVRDINISNFQKYTSLDEAISHYYADLVEVKVSNPLRIIHNLASSFHMPVKPKSSKLEVRRDRLKTSIKRTKDASDLNKFFIQADTVGSDDLPGNMSLGSSGSMDIKGNSCLELDSSSMQLHGISSVNSIADIVPVENQRYGSDPATKDNPKKRNGSFSNIDTTSLHYYDHSASASNTAVSKGFLHCIWKGGIPHFVFTVDDRREAYVANPWKVKSDDDETLNWNYLFHSRMDGKKRSKGSGDMSDLIGRMKVSHSTLPNSNNSNPPKFIETKFVLFGINNGHGEDCVRETSYSTHVPRKNKGSQKKVPDMFRTSHMSRHDPATKFTRFSSEFKDISQGLYPDMICDFDGSSKEDLLADYLPANLELAAIVVKGYHHQNNSREAAVGGWGLKFLEKVATERADTSLRFPIDDSLFSSEYCLQNGSSKSILENSTSVIIPAGFHGGPRSRNGGPSTLTDRWRSGGHCDCGGWDIGCPLTVLNSRSSNKKGLFESGGEKDCESVGLFIEGAKQGVPALKMVNIHEGLYFIHFQSTLSALQSFSIGVAIIHTQSRALGSKMYSS